MSTWARVLVRGIVTGIVVALVVACGHGAARPAHEPADSCGGVDDGSDVAVGKAAPPFSKPTIDGKGKVVMPSGKVTLLVFWATWSEPDKRELVTLQDLYARYAEHGLGIIALSIDDEPSGLATFASTYKLQFPIAWDDGHTIASRYRPHTDPSTLLVDAKGIVRYRHDGWHDGEVDELEKEVAEVLGRPMVAPRPVVKEATWLVTDQLEAKALAKIGIDAQSGEPVIPEASYSKAPPNMVIRLTFEEDGARVVLRREEPVGRTIVGVRTSRPEDAKQIYTLTTSSPTGGRLVLTRRADGTTIATMTIFGSGRPVVSSQRGPVSY